MQGPEGDQVTFGRSDQSEILLAKIEGQLNNIARILQRQTGLQERYLTPNQVMQELSINRTTFERWTKGGVLKVYRLTDRKVYCRKSDIDHTLNRPVWPTGSHRLPTL